MAIADKRTSDGRDIARMGYSPKRLGVEKAPVCPINTERKAVFTSSVTKLPTNKRHFSDSKKRLSGSKTTANASQTNCSTKRTYLFNKCVITAERSQLIRQKPYASTEIAHLTYVYIFARVNII